MPNSLTDTLRSPKAILITLGGIVIMSVGVVIALLITGDSTDPRMSASVPDGTVEISISPAARTLNAGESTTLTVTLDPKGVAISGIAARVRYSFTGDQPLLTASNPNPLISQADSNWDCQVVSTTVGTNVVQVDLGCLYVSQEGYISNIPVPLHNFTVTAGSTPTATPFTLSFEPESTVVTSKATGEDIAAIPTSSSVITVAAAAASPSPTPTATPTPTGSLTPSPTGSLTPTPTGSLTPTPTNTSGLATCNQTCIASRDCQSGLSCYDGRCRSDQCSTDTTCTCNDYDVASASGTTQLPDSGLLSYTVLTILLGGLLIFSGGSYLLYALTHPESV